MKHLDQRTYTEAADTVHDAVCNGDDVLRPETVAKDIERIERIVRRIEKLTDKSFAHIERDRRRIPRRIPYRQFDDAIRILFQTFDRYSLCLFGEHAHSHCIEDETIAEKLQSLWTNSG